MFCGVGGFRLGLENTNAQSPMRKSEERRNGDIGIGEVQLHIGQTASFRCVWANDNDKYACQVYRERFGNKELVEENVWKIKAKEIPNHELLTGGFPCQSFSVAGKRRGFQDITRGTLFFKICAVLRTKKPRYLLLENVKGLLSHDKGRTFAIILLSLDELGYDVEWQVLNTKYWLPQNRERVFIFGTRREGR